MEVKKGVWGPGDMALLLRRVLVALTEDPGSQLPMTPVPGDPAPPSGLHPHQACMWDTDTQTSNTHIGKIKIHRLGGAALMSLMSIREKTVENIH